MTAAVAQLTGEVAVAKAPWREDCVEERKGTFRAHIKKSGHAYFGPSRSSKAEAPEDAQTLLAAANISVTALPAAENQFRQQPGAQEESVEKAVLEAMRYWAQQGSTSDLRGTSRAHTYEARRDWFGASSHVQCCEAIGGRTSGDREFFKRSFSHVVTGTGLALEA